MCPSSGTKAPQSKSFRRTERGTRGNEKSPEVRTLALKVFRIKCLRNQLVLSWQRPHAYDNTNASGCHFVQPLVGNRCAPKTILRTHHEICRRKVIRMDVLPDQLHGITGNHGKSQLDGQLGYHLLTHLQVRANHYKYFVLFLQHIPSILFVQFTENHSLRIVNWDNSFIYDNGETNFSKA